MTDAINTDSENQRKTKQGKYQKIYSQAYDIQTPKNQRQKENTEGSHGEGEEHKLSLEEQGQESHWVVFLFSPKAIQARRA